MAYPENLFFYQKIDNYRLPSGKNWCLWCHFGDTRCQGNMTLNKSKKLVYIGGDILLFIIFNLCKFCSPLFGFFWFVPGFVEGD
jgi:hypothetical protein